MLGTTTIHYVKSQFIVNPVMQFQYIYGLVTWRENSVDPDSWLHQKPVDLDLHFLKYEYKILKKKVLCTVHTVHILGWILFEVNKMSLSYDVASGSEITPCNKIDKPLVVYRFMGNLTTSITTLRT